MSSTIAELHYGATRICLRQGRALDNLAAGIYADGNSRAVMGAGLSADLRRAAGAGVERELRAFAPLMVGEAYLTSSGELSAMGVVAIAHGVVVTEQGVTSSIDLASRALLSGLRLLEDAGCRSVSVPQVAWRVAGLDHDAAAVELARVVLTHLRRQTKLNEFIIVSLHRDYLDMVADTFRKQLQNP